MRCVRTRTREGVDRSMVTYSMAEVLAGTGGSLRGEAPGDDRFPAIVFASMRGDPK